MQCIYHNALLTNYVFVSCTSFACRIYIYTRPMVRSFFARPLDTLLAMGNVCGCCGDAGMPTNPGYTTGGGGGGQKLGGGSVGPPSGMNMDDARDARLAAAEERERANQLRGTQRKHPASKKPSYLQPGNSDNYTGATTELSVRFYNSAIQYFICLPTFSRLLISTGLVVDKFYFLG